MFNVYYLQNEMLSATFVITSFGMNIFRSELLKISTDFGMCESVCLDQ